MTIENKLKEKIDEMMGDLELLVGYSPSALPLKVNPAFIEKKEETGSLIFNKLCINNLASYIYDLSKSVKGTIGIVLKPCDTRSIIQLASEELIDLKKIKMIVPGCSGVLDYKKIQKHIGGEKIISYKLEGENLTVETISQKHELKAGDFYADKCYWCQVHDNPPHFDEFIENDQKLDIEPREKYADIDAIESKSIDEIMQYWDEQFSNCIRCYACRNICPLEICRDRCITNLDEPYWQSQRINKEEGKFFQLIRVLHLAGRCTECGECERACPSDIPLSKLMKKSAQITERLFEYKTGEEPDKKPPFLTFKDVEKNIKEENLS